MPYIVTQVAHALRGLSLPGHLGITPNGRVFVSDFGSGSIHEVTAAPSSGHAAGQSLVLDGLLNPSGIHPVDDNTLLIADSGNGHLREIKIGAVALNKSSSILSSNFSNPYGIFAHDGKIYTTFSNNRMSGIVEVKPGSNFADSDVYVSGFPVVIQSEPYPLLAGCGGSWGGTGSGSTMLFSHYALGTVFDVSGGGDFESLREKRYAWALNGPLGIITDPLDNDLYVVEKGSGVIKCIQKTGGYSRFAPPLLAGFQEPSCIRFLPDGSAAYVCDRAWGTVFRLDLQHV